MRRSNAFLSLGEILVLLSVVKISQCRCMKAYFIVSSSSLSFLIGSVKLVEQANVKLNSSDRSKIILIVSV